MSAKIIIECDKCGKTIEEELNETWGISTESYLNNGWVEPGEDDECIHYCDKCSKELDSE